MNRFRILYLLFFVTLPISLVAQFVHPKYEYRAVWLTVIENLDWPRTQVRSEADIRVQKQELIGILDSLSMLNVNCVMLQTRVRGDVIYPSAIEPFSKALTNVSGGNPGYDPLAFAIDECHKRGMQLHAWVVALPLGSAQYVKEQGRKALKNRKPSLCRLYKGSWYMEPGRPGTADYLCDLVSEIVSGYNVDGIHLDYIRYPDRPNGYPDGNLHSRYGRGLSLGDWRRSNITEIVRRVYGTVKALKPWVMVSCAPLGKHDDLTAYSSLGWNARCTVFQDAQEWMREGIMDALFPMLYFKGNDFYPFVLDWNENICSRHIAPGMGTYRLLPQYGDWDAVELQRQMLTTRSAGAAGTVMFRTRHLLDDIDNFSHIYSAINRYKALVPPMKWLSTKEPQAPSALNGHWSGDTLFLSWIAADAAPSEPPMRYNLYVSTDSIVNIGDATNILTLMHNDTAYAWVGAPRTTMQFAVTAVDAYGIESRAARWECRFVYPRLRRDEFLLPHPCDWGMRIVIRDASGMQLYSTPYSMRVGVRGLLSGVYTLEVVARDGRILSRIPFSR